MNEEVICKVCGEPNKIGSNYCSSCGAIISEKSGWNKSEKEKLDNSGKQNSSTAGKRTSKNSNAESKPASLSTKKLIYIMLALILTGAFILISSGIFERPTNVTMVNQNSEQSNPHAGVDLNSLNQITELEKTVNQNPNDKKSLLTLAHLLNDSGFKDKAIERYQEYLKLDPKNADVWVDMGVCYYDRGKNDEAISAMEKALKIQPRHQIANLNLGIVNMAEGNKTKAINYWQKAAQIDSTNEIGQKAKELLNSH